MGLRNRLAQFAQTPRRLGIHLHIMHIIWGQ